MGLAEPVGEGRYRLADGLDDILRRIGERGDIIRLMQRELTARRMDRQDRIIADPDRGFADEHHDRHYLLIDGVDGRAHYVDVGRGDATEPNPEGSIVRISGRNVTPRQVDRTIAEVAAANGGRYSIDFHLRHDRSASEAFAESHVRRLEAMRRAGSGVERAADGSWAVGSDHIGRAVAYGQRQLRERPVDVERLSAMALDDLSRPTDRPGWIANLLPTQIYRSATPDLVARCVLR